MPAGLGVCWGGPGILNSEKGTRHRPLASNRPGLFIFTTVSLAQQAGAGQQRVFIGGGARKGRIHAPKPEKPAGSKRSANPLERGDDGMEFREIRLRQASRIAEYLCVRRVKGQKPGHRLGCDPSGNSEEPFSGSLPLPGPIVRSPDVRAG